MAKDNVEQCGKIKRFSLLSLSAVMMWVGASGMVMARTVDRQDDQEENQPAAAVISSDLVLKRSIAALDHRMHRLHARANMVVGNDSRAIAYPMLPAAYNPTLFGSQIVHHSPVSLFTASSVQASRQFTGNGALQLCPKDEVGGTKMGSWFGYDGSVQGDCNNVEEGRKNYAFSLLNSGLPSGGVSDDYTAGIVGFNDGRLQLTGRKGITIQGPSSFDSNANFNDNKITQLKAGEDGSDAVNVSQLSGVLAGLGGGAGMGDDGVINRPTYMINGHPYDDVGKALEGLDQNVTDHTGTLALLEDEIKKLKDCCKRGGDGDDDSGDGGGDHEGGDHGDNGQGGVHNGDNGSMSVGNGSQANGDNATAEGQNSLASGQNSKANGQDARATGDNTTAVGQGTRAPGENSTALGQGAQATGDNATAEGQNSLASGKNSKANGQDARATGDNTTAVGQGTRALGENSTALGQGSKATGVGSVALGQDSIAERDHTVSVGSAGHERTLSNVAPGVQGTDAVNKNQLDALAKNSDQRILDLDRNTRRGIAAAAAIPTPILYLPGRTGASVAVTSYRGAQAIGVALSGWNAKGNFNWLVGSSFAGGPNTIFKIGATYMFGN